MSLKPRRSSKPNYALLCTFNASVFLVQVASVNLLIKNMLLLQRSACTPTSIARSGSVGYQDPFEKDM